VGDPAAPSAPPSPLSPPTPRTKVLLGFAALVGAAMGGYFFPTVHHAIESAQALAGLVDYARDNPFYIYHLNTWSLLHQLLAVALELGTTERQLAFAVSALIGAASYWVIAYCAWNLGLRNAGVVLIPLVIHLLRLNDHGPLYPVWLMGSHSSYGIIGLTLGMAAANLFVDRHGLKAGTLLTASLAVHPLLASFTIAALAFAIRLSPALRAIARERRFHVGLVIGLAITAASLMAFLQVRIGGSPQDDPAEQALLLKAFTAHWSTHAVQLPLLSLGAAMALVSALLPLLSIRLRQNPLAIFASGASVLGLAAGALSWIPLHLLHPLLEKVLLVRYVSYGIFFAPVALLAVLFIRNVGLALVFSVVGLAFVLATPGAPPRDALVAILAALCLLPARHASGRRDRLVLGTTVSCVTAAVLTLALMRASPEMRFAYRFPVTLFHADMQDRTTDAFWARVASDEGVLVHASMDCIQLLTRRPVAMSHAINQMSYVPESGPAINRVMKTAFGLDLLHPPASPYPHSGTLDERLYGETWCKRPLAEWSAIGRALGITNVLAWKGCMLDLPLEAETERFRYYRVPRE
jgi:hypothetical protein